MRLIYFISLFIIILTLNKVQGQFDGTIDSLKLLLATNQEAKARATIYHALALEFLYSDPDKALLHAAEAYRLADSNELPLKKLDALLSLAEIYLQKSEMELSLEYSLEARELAKELKQELSYASAILIIGKHQRYQGNYTESFDRSYEALKIFEKYQDKKGMSKALNRIGNLASQIGEDDKALQYYIHSLNLAKEANDFIGISSGINNIAAHYGNKGDYSNFKDYIQQALTINKKYGVKLWEGINYVNLAAAYRHEKNHDSVLYYYDKAMLIFRDLNKASHIAMTYEELANYYKDIDSLDKGIVFGQKAYELAKENNIKVGIRDAARVLWTIYSANNNYQNAFEYSIIEKQYSDSLNTEKAVTHLAQLELLQKFDKERQHSELKQQRTKFILIIVGTSIIFILLLYITHLRNKHRLRVKNSLLEKQELEMDLEIKNKVLTTNVMYSIQKNEVLTSITAELVDIKKSAAKEETREAIQRISRKIKESVKDNAWEEFEIRFQQVYKDFYKTISSKFPDLTPNEKRLCAFLRLDMSSKEISKITGQSIPALEVARVRLRKKLGITNTDTNLVTFLSKY